MVNGSKQYVSGNLWIYKRLMKTGIENNKISWKNLEVILTSLQSLRPWMVVLGVRVKKSSSTVCLEVWESCVNPWEGDSLFSNILCNRN